MSRTTRALRLNRLQTRSERQLRREMRALFRVFVGKAASIAARGHDVASLEQDLQDRLRVTLTRAYRRAMLLSRDEVYATLGLNEGKAIGDVFEEIAEAWIASNVGDKIVTIASGFIGSVRVVVRKAFDEGLGQEETARLIRKKVGKDYSQWRAARVARTEMAAAANKGSDAAAKSTGLEMVKEWSAADDARTRPQHAAADGQLREMDEPFVVGDSLLMHPGDPSGPAGQVINCRCVVLYHPRVSGEVLR